MIGFDDSYTKPAMAYNLSDEAIVPEFTCIYESVKEVSTRKWRDAIDLL